MKKGFPNSKIVEMKINIKEKANNITYDLVEKKNLNIFNNPDYAKSIY